MDQTFVNPKFSDAGIPHLHKPAFNPNEINDLHGGFVYFSYFVISN